MQKHQPFFLSFFLLKQCKGYGWILSGSLFWKKKKNWHLRKGSVWSTALKTQRTSLRIYTKLSVLIAKPLVLLKILKTSQPTVILLWKNPIWNFFENLWNWMEVITKNQRTTTSNYTGMDYGLQRVVVVVVVVVHSTKTFLHTNFSLLIVLIVCQLSWW